MGDVVLPNIGFVPVSFAGLQNTVQVIATRSTRIGGWTVYNPNAAVTYLVFFDKVGAIVLGTDIPKFWMPMPATAAANLAFGKHGIYMANGLQISCTTSALGSGGPSSGMDVSIFYQ